MEREIGFRIYESLGHAMHRLSGLRKLRDPNAMTLPEDDGYVVICHAGCHPSTRHFRLDQRNEAMAAWMEKPSRKLP